MERRAYDAPLWQGEDLDGRHLYVYPEQGYGDNILASRFVPGLAARGARITLECLPRLRRLFSSLGADRNVLPGVVSDGFDFHCPMLSLPRALGATTDSLPPIPPLWRADFPPGIAEPLLSLAGGQLKVGITWAGHHSGRPELEKRDAPLQRFVELAQVPGLQLYSLQVGPPGDELDDIGTDRVFDLGPFQRDFADAAAILAQLDLVISTDTSLAHLTGALGTPGWILLPHEPFWFWGTEGDNTRWYPSLRLFRQARPGGWDEVFARVKRDLLTAAAGRPLEGPEKLELTSACKRFVLPVPGRLLPDADVAYFFEHETRYGGYEHAARRFFDAHLESNDLLIDIGAHLGVFALSAAGHWPGSLRVLAIEPAPENVAGLQNAIEVNDRRDQIEVVAAAAGAACGRARLRFDSTTEVSGLRRDGVDVDVVTIDALLEQRLELQSRRVFLKINVDGVALEVLQGARLLLSSGRVAAVIWERGPACDSADRLRAVREELAEYGFTHYRLPSDNLGGPLVPFVPTHELHNVYSLGPGMRPRSYSARVADPAPLPIRPPSPTLGVCRRVKLVKELIAAEATDAGRWADPRFLDGDGGLRAARRRAALAARHISPAERIIDLGAGRQLLHAGSDYVPVDLVRWTDRTQIADFNGNGVPRIEGDVAVALETLEYVHDIERFLEGVRRCALRLVLSYETAGDGQAWKRRAKGWFHDLTRNDLLRALDRTAWRVTGVTEYREEHPMFVVARAAPRTTARSR